MKRPQRGAPRALRPLPLPKGVLFHARVLDPFTSARVDAAVERDINAIVRGEAPEREWGVSDAQAEALAADMVLRREFADWMRLVVLAELCVESVDGIEEDDGGAAAPSFDLFFALLEEEAFALAFERVAVLLAVRGDDEKNAFGRGPSGSSAAAPISAQDAAPATTPLSGTPAPEASASATKMDNGDAAPVSSTPPEPTQGPSPGASSAAPDAGSPASADSPA